MEKESSNYAFIDSQNLNLGILELGWKLDFRRFRIYLKEKYAVTKTYLFIGYISDNQDLYDSLNRAGYQLIFKPVIKDKHGQVKGNVDADLVLQVMLDYLEYNKAVIVTSDGDFYSIVDHLYYKDKLEVVLCPNKKSCSILLKSKAREKMMFLDKLRKKLEYKKRSTA